MSQLNAERKTLEVLAEEFVARYRHGERPSLSEYIDAHPELADEIRELFPTLVMMEELAPSDSDSMAQPTVAPPQQPRLSLGDYRILREIGRGGMGIVYEAEQLSLGRRVALKVLRLTSGDATVRQRFHREARAAAQLHHTNIVPVYDVGEDQDTCWYAMQLILGQGLDQIFTELRQQNQQRSGEPQSPQTGGDQGTDAPRSEAQPLLSQVTHALVTGAFVCPDLDAAESSPAVSREPEASALCHGCVSRGEQLGERPGEQPRLTQPWHNKGESASLDASDSTRMASRSELSAGDSWGSQYFRSVARIGRQVAEALVHAHARGIIHRDIKPSNLLLDTAGVVWITDFGLAKTQDTALTTTGDIVGTVRYMAPERLKGEGDERGDVYALGLTLYEMLVLRPAFAVHDRLQLIDRIKNQEPTRPRVVDRRIPRDLETIILKAIDKEAKRRYQTAEAMAEDLRRFLANEPIKAHRTSHLVRLRLWCRRNPALAVLWLVLAVVAAGATATAFYLRVMLAESEAAHRQEQAAKREARLHEANALVGQAHGTRLSRRSGQRFDALNALGKAAAIGQELGQPPEWFDRLRNEAIAALALPDVHITQEFGSFPPGSACAELNDDFSWYVRTTDKGGCTIRRVDDDTEVARLPELGGPAEAYFGLGRILAVCGPSGRFQLWDLSGAEAVLRIEVPGIHRWGFRKDGQLLVLSHLDGAISVYETASGKRVHQLAAVQIVWGLDAQLHPAAPFVACWSYAYHDVQVRNLHSGAVVATAVPPWRLGSHASWSPDGHTLLVAEADGGIIQEYAFDTAAPALRLIRSIQGQSQGDGRLTFNPTGDRFVWRGWGNVVVLFDAVSGQELFHTPSLTPASDFRRLRFDRTGQRLACARVGDRKDRIGVWSVADAREYRSVVPAGNGVNGLHIGSIVVHPGGRLAAGSVTDGVVLFDLDTGHELAHLAISPDWCSVAFDGTGSLLTNGFEGFFRWPVRADAANPSRLTVGPPERLPFNPGRHLIAASYDGRVIAQCMWNGYGEQAFAGGWILHPNSPTPRRVEAGHSIGDCCVSPDGRWVVFGRGGPKVYDSATGRPVWQCPAVGDDSSQFTPDGRWLVTGVDHGRVYTAGTWEPGPQLGSGSLRSVTSELAIYGRTDGIYRLVELATGRELARLEDPELNSGAATLTPDGTKLVIAAKNGLRVWDLRHIRAELTKLGLDWVAPPYPPAPRGADATPLAAKPLEVTVDLGSLFPQEPPQQAIVKYSLALAVLPINPVAYLRRGHAYYQLQEWHQAADDLGLALALDPNNKDTVLWLELGTACHNSRRLEEAVAAYSRFIELRGGDASIYNRRSVAYYCLGQWEKGIADLDEALILQPDFPMVKNNLAWILATCPEAKLRDPLRAVELATQAVAAQPEEGSSLTTLGIAQYRAGDWKAARDALQKALERGQGGGNIYWFGRTTLFLAMSHWKLGDQEKACKYYDQAVEWMKKNQSVMEKDQGRWNELRRFRAEADSVLTVTTGPREEIGVKRRLDTPPSCATAVSAVVYRLGTADKAVAQYQEGVPPSWHG